VSFHNRFCNSGLSDETEIPSLEYHPFLSVFDPLFNIFLGILHFGILSFNPKLRVHHFVVMRGTLNVELAREVNLKV
jgi:hypothetical protein